MLKQTPYKSVNKMLIIEDRKLSPKEKGKGKLTDKEKFKLMQLRNRILAKRATNYVSDKATRVKKKLKSIFRGR